MARFWMNAASTSLRVNPTVWSSTLSILVMLVSIPMSVKYGNSVGYALRNGSSLLIMRLKVNSTSSALNSRVGLKYGVVWNFDTVTQVEGVRQAVSGDVPAGRQARNYGGAAALELGQAVEHGFGRGVEVGSGGVLTWIETGRAPFGAEHQVSRSLGERCAG